MALIEKIKNMQVIRPPCDPSAKTVSALADLEVDISCLFPYLNAVLKRAQYFPSGPYFKFRFENKFPTTLHPKKIAVAKLLDREQAEKVVRKLCDFLNQVWEERDQITPNPKGFERPPSAIEIYKHLPKTNCGRCGQTSCMAFASLLSAGEVEIEDCSVLYEEEKYQSERRALLKLFGQEESVSD